MDFPLRWQILLPKCWISRHLGEKKKRKKTERNESEEREREKEIVECREQYVRMLLDRNEMEWNKNNRDVNAKTCSFFWVKLPYENHNEIRILEQWQHTNDNDRREKKRVKYAAWCMLSNNLHCLFDLIWFHHKKECHVFDWNVWNIWRIVGKNLAQISVKILWFSNFWGHSEEFFALRVTISTSKCVKTIQT